MRLNKEFIFFTYLIESYANYKGISAYDALKLLDDKKLTRAFERVIDKGIMNDIPLSKQKEVLQMLTDKAITMCLLEILNPHLQWNPSYHDNSILSF